MTKERKRRSRTKTGTIINPNRWDYSVTTHTKIFDITFQMAILYGSKQMSYPLLHVKLNLLFFCLQINCDKHLKISMSFNQLKIKYKYIYLAAIYIILKINKFEEIRGKRELNSLEVVSREENNNFNVFSLATIYICSWPRDVLLSLSNFTLNTLDNISS